MHLSQGSRCRCPDPEPHPDRIGEQTLKTVHADLKAVLIGEINVSPAVERLNMSFSKVYQGILCQHTDLVLAHPIFNAEGNLFLQLLPEKEDSTSNRTLNPGQVLE